MPYVRYPAVSDGRYYYGRFGLPEEVRVVSGEYLPRVMAVLGKETGRRLDPEVWERIEDDLGFALPDDYKALVDAYAPVKLNGHLILNHPETPRWNLREFIRDTCLAWSEIPWGDDVDGDPRVVLNLAEMEFGTLHGLTPIASADSGQTIFWQRIRTAGPSCLRVGVATHGAG